MNVINWTIKKMLFTEELTKSTGSSDQTGDMVSVVWGNNKMTKIISVNPLITIMIT